MSVINVHTAATQLHHAIAHVAQTGQIELGVAVCATHPLSLSWRQNAVGTDHLACLCDLDQQVLAVVVKQVHVMAWQRCGQACTHFGTENIKPEFLYCVNFVLMPSPLDFKGFFRRLCRKIDTSPELPG
jgi:hypothetical protein